jgi:hypothetical protein
MLSKRVRNDLKIFVIGIKKRAVIIFSWDKGVGSSDFYHEAHRYKFVVNCVCVSSVFCYVLEIDKCGPRNQNKPCRQIDKFDC